MFDTIEFFEKQKREKANIEAFTHAVGWSCLFNGFAGKNDKKSEYSDLLPFPEEIKPKESNLLSPSTLEVTKKLIKRGVLPEHVTSYLIMVVPEISSFLAKEF